MFTQAEKKRRNNTQNSHKHKQQQTLSGMGVKGFTTVLQSYFPTSVTKIDPLVHPSLFQSQRFGSTTVAPSASSSVSFTDHHGAHARSGGRDGSRHSGSGLKQIASFGHLLKSSSFRNYDHLLFDMNCVLIATLRRKEFHFDSNSCDERQQRRMQSLNRRVFLAIDNYLNGLIRAFDPRSSVHLCLDGPGPVCKIPTQSRSRNRVNDRWSNLLQVTTGTRFMSDYHTYVRKVYGSSVLRRFDHLKRVHFSSSNMPGEGECKIFKSIAQLNKHGPEHQKFIVCSVDADLILYAVAALESNVDILLLKESNHYVHVNISKLIEHYIQPIHEDVSATRKDFVLLSLLNGSDYVPKFGSETPLSTWMEYTRIRTESNSKFSDRSIISWNSNLNRFEIDVDFLLTCMPMRKIDARQVHSTLELEHTVINYFQLVLWNFQMLINGECTDYWFLPNGFTIAPRWYDVEAVYRSLGHEEFNRRIQSKERIHFETTSHLQPFLPHELCSAVTPSFYRQFVPTSLQSLDPFVDYATRSVFDCMHPEGSLNFKSLLSYQDLIKGVVNSEDISQFETSDILDSVTTI